MSINYTLVPSPDDKELWLLAYNGREVRIDKVMMEKKDGELKYNFEYTLIKGDPVDLPELTELMGRVIIDTYKYKSDRADYLKEKELDGE